MYTLGAVLIAGIGSWNLSLQDTVLMILAAIITAIIYWFRPEDDKDPWRRRSGGNQHFYVFTFLMVYVILMVLNSWKMQ